MILNFYFVMWIREFLVRTNSTSDSTKRKRMQKIEVTKHGDFQVATARGGEGFVSWAKMGTIVADCPVEEPGSHVWFNFGSTREEARGRILKELNLL